MSVGSNLQEMENVVTKGAKSAEPMPKLTTGIPDGQSGSWEDLGGPTPENYRPDDNSAKLKEPSATLAQVKDVVNKGAKPAEPMKKMASPVKEEEEIEDENLISESEEDGEDDSDEKSPKGKKKKEDDYEDEDEESEEMSEEVDELVEEESEFEEDYSIEEDVNALLSGEDLSEEFQEKARVIFESAIKSKVSEIKEQLQEQYQNSLIEEIQLIKESLVERVDAYLEYVSDEWISENALAVEHGLKTEMTESFLTGMKQLFEEHYVTIPEDRYDVIESMVDKLDEMEGKLNEQIEKNVALNQRLAESVADVIFAEVAEGLALSQKDKLASLAENVEFDGEERYREKLVTLRESYFPTKTTSSQRETTENLAEEAQYSEQPQVSGRMESYLSVLSRVSKK
jgi:hypothetical protein